MIKVRPTSERLLAVVEDQRCLFEAGFPCPEPLAGPAALGPDVATAPDDLDVDLNEASGFEWLDHAAEQVRARLREDEGRPVVGHADREAHNIGWENGQPIVVYERDSLSV